MICNIEAKRLKFSVYLRAITDTIFRNEIEHTGNVLQVELFADIKLNKVHLTNRKHGEQKFLEDTDDLCRLLLSDELLRRATGHDLQAVSVVALDFTQADYNLSRYEVHQERGATIESVTLGKSISASSHT